MDLTICAAPDCNKERKGRYHCLEHIKFVLPLYVAYKRLEEGLVKKLPVDLQTKDVKKLLQCHNRLKEAHRMRSEYREKAFKREYWDTGHEFRLGMLLEWMIDVEKRLTSVFTSPTPIQIQPNKEECKEECIIDEDCSEEQSIEAVRKYNTKVIEEEKVWNETIPQIIKEHNEDALKKSDDFRTIVKICVQSLNEKHWKLYTKDMPTLLYTTSVLIHAALEIIGRLAHIFDTKGKTTTARICGLMSNGDKLSYLLYAAKDGLQFLNTINNIPNCVPILLAMLLDTHCSANKRYRVKWVVATNYKENHIGITFFPFHTRIPLNVPIEGAIINAKSLTCERGIISTCFNKECLR